MTSAHVLPSINKQQPASQHKDDIIEQTGRGGACVRLRPT